MTIVSGPQKGQRFRLNDREPTVVGRETTADLAVVDPMMSRRHFEIVSQAGRLHIRDLGSRNGTTVNSRRVDSTSIDRNDVVSAGLTTFRVDLEEPGHGASRGQTVLPPQAPHDIENLKTWEFDEKDSPLF